VKKLCRECGEKIDTHKDGSFVMHAKRDRGLCPGTNRVRMDHVKTVKMGPAKGTIEIEVEAIEFDPDMSLEG
jgi:hypothetical protein